jgi:DegV family protein with EDD domain
MAGVAVVTDSTASLDPAQAARAGVAVIPLQVVIDERSRPESEVPAAEVAAALRAGRQVTTSRPTPEVIGHVYTELAAAGYAAVVSAHLSARISGTCGAAQVAADAASVPVTVVDTCTLALAAGFATLAGARAAEAGAGAEAVAAVIRRHAAASETYFYVDSLEYLKRGGRIGTAAALLGSALSVKPLLTIADGQIRAYERVRTESKALARLVELGLAALARAAGHSDEVDLAVHHLDNPEGAQWLVDQLSDRVPAGRLVVAEVSAVLGVHVGPGTLGVVVSPRL